VTKVEGCPAPTHTSEWSIRNGCVCPEARERVRAQRRAAEPRGHLHRARGWRGQPAEAADVDIYLAKTGKADQVSIGARIAAAAELHRAGLSNRQIAERLRVARRTVQRYRERAAA